MSTNGPNNNITMHKQHKKSREQKKKKDGPRPKSARAPEYKKNHMMQEYEKLLEITKKNSKKMN